MDRILFFSLIGICCFAAFIVNTKHLYDSVLFYNEVKNLRKLKKFSATVIYESTSLLNMMATVKSGSGPTSVKMAVEAMYHGNKLYKMVCAHDKRIREGANVEVILCKKKKLFAFSVQQIKNALVTYSTYTVLFLCASLFMFWNVYSAAVKLFSILNS